MQNTIQIQCPSELLLRLGMSAEAFAELVKTCTAISLFKEGKMSSGTAAHWLNIPRLAFLFKAMEAGAEFLEDSQDDFARETVLL
ncbi:hypothetical protein U27_03582 [Candidatus Vecturithrix granuli]|uniref:Uncharacterized protein n=1 Tax=Vecturithrix granuli TaxID=1499967 RepID=A0A081BWB4_VECG1|nr:hypothetical protein U27_03582 [Candidatus Vecturithrix granuli]